MLKKLAAFLGFLCLVLLLLAFDEGQMERGATAMRARVEPTIARLRDTPVSLPEMPQLPQLSPLPRLPTLPRLPQLPERPAPPPAEATAGPMVVTGAFLAPEGQAGGDVSFDAALLSFRTAPALRTRPHRIVPARDADARGLGVPPDRQVELREIVPLNAATPVAPSPLCAGAVPGWIAVVRDGRGVRLQFWRAGPAPDAPGAVVCGRFDYEDARG